MMTTLRCLAVCGCLALLAGCYSTKPCELPGRNSYDPAVSCYYQLTINQVYMDTHLVKAQLPSVLKAKDGDYPGEIIEFKKSAEYMNDGEFTFPVRNFEKVGSQIQIGKVHEFNRVGNSPYLELLPGEPRADDPPPKDER